MPENEHSLSLLHQWMAALMHRSMCSLIQFTREHELSMSQVAVLSQVHHGGRHITDLAQMLGISNAAASQMLDRLVQQGLVLRSEDPQDRRLKQLVLTGKGQGVLQESIRARQDWLAELVSSLSPQESEQVAAALRILLDKTQKLDQLPEAGR
jgi:DNA-binding MarR family transcriptional regulator